MSELRPETTAPKSWAARHAVGLATAAVGALSIAVTSIVHFGHGQRLSVLPPLRLTIPFVVVAVGLAAYSLVRREGAWWLPLIGVALSTCAIALGWVVALAVIIGVTVLVIVVMSQVM